MTPDLTRERDKRLAPIPSPATPPDAGGAAFVGKVTTATTAVGKYLLVTPQTVSGTQSEGSTGSVVDRTNAASVPALLIGPNAAISGDNLVCRWVDHRWIAERGLGGGGTVSVPGCPCGASPITITMSVTNPAANGNIIQSAVLVWGPTPSSLLSVLGASSYLSTATFVDAGFGYTFWYQLGCFVGYYVLRRVALTSVFGSPFVDQVRYRWPIGLSGNTCTPFDCHVGQIFSGGDPSTVATLTG